MLQPHVVLISFTKQSQMIVKQFQVCYTFNHTKIGPYKGDVIIT